MQAISDAFRNALTSSHRVVAYMDVLGSNHARKRLMITEGDVEVDRTADVQRRCSATVVDPTGELTPEQASELLTPYGTRLFPYRGIMFDNGTTEVVQLGEFRLSSTTITDEGGQVTISLDAYDLSRTVARDKFVAPYTIDKGTNIISAIKRIVRRTFDNVQTACMDTYRTVPTKMVIDVESDPWQVCQELATSSGMEVYFDVRGRLVVAPVPDISNLPAADFTYIEGKQCIMLDLERSYDDENAFNGVVVTGEAPDEESPPVRAVVWDDDPTSVTYHLGPYGEVPTFHTDDTITTENEARLVAKTKLDKILGFVTKIDITVLPNPAFEPGDTIKVVRDDIGVEDRFVLDGFSIPLVPGGEQELTLRQKRIQ